MGLDFGSPSFANDDDDDECISENESEIFFKKGCRTGADSTDSSICSAHDAYMSFFLVPFTKPSSASIIPRTTCVVLLQQEEEQEMPKNNRKQERGGAVGSSAVSAD